MKGGDVDMPREEDPSLKTENGLYISKIKASENYDKNNVDNVRLRVPKGWKEQMQAYVESSDKYNSVNAMLCELIRKELNIKE